MFNSSLDMALHSTRKGRSKKVYPPMNKVMALYQHMRRIHSQAGRGSEHPGLVEAVPAHCRGVGLDGL